MDDASVDMDIDQCLVGKFSSLGTTDKDVLIDEFRKLLGFQLNAAGCEFFLDMTNWNLHAAIGAYYDFEMPSTKIPSMRFIKDVTIGEGESIPPETEFLKTWRIENSGDEQWPFGCTLRFVNGDKMAAADWVSVQSLNPGQFIDVSVKMRSPNCTGIYQGQWKIYTKSMIPFGEQHQGVEILSNCQANTPTCFQRTQDTIWVVITVEVGGLLGVTQQFVNTLGSSSKPLFESHLNSNPFSSDHNSEVSRFVAENAIGSFKTIESSCATNDCDNLEMEINEKRDAHSRDLTNTPELDRNHASAPQPSGACWNSRSPTMYGPVDRLSGASHSLQSIAEERGTVAKQSDLSFAPSCSSYDLCARQVTPCNSPSHLLELERSFNSPDAPSPIRPAVQNDVCQKSFPAAQKLDFCDAP